MPRRTDIESILLIGSGPIVIGQACEFDYSGTQACKALKEEGFRIILVNSNPATIMTDPEFAHRTYIEPITPEFVEKIIDKERPHALLPTLGGQTALNVSITLAEKGVLEKFRVEMIGAKVEAIMKAEDREEFKRAMLKIGLEVPRSGYAHSLKEALRLLDSIGLPAVIRPSFTLGGTGGNVAYDLEQFKEYVQWGLGTSPIHKVLIEQSVLGWKEYELEVMRDLKDNVVIICPIENFDPMGIHTGDSITVAPAQTLTDKEYQLMRDAALKVMREIGVDTGGSNIQFAVNPIDGRMVIIEMNPRVSRSSALASKATGFPIAKIAAKLAVGYTLDEIVNDITRETPASFEPAIDYVVTKIPRFAFEKFPSADSQLTTQMKSVGEVMAIGRTFKESLQKAIRSLEIDSFGFEKRFVSESHLSLNPPLPPFGNPPSHPPLVKGGKGGFRGFSEEQIECIRDKLKTPNWERLWYIAEAFRAGLQIEKIHELTCIDPWFLYHIQEIVETEKELEEERERSKVKGQKSHELRVTGYGLNSQHLTLNTLHLLRKAKEYGFSDHFLAKGMGVDEREFRSYRKKLGIEAVFKKVDTCAAEFEAYTPYLYSTYEREDESNVSSRRKVIILGAGPNRIGQGIEFDYCCVHGSFALKEEDIESIMVNCNPETVSTDYDTSDRLYFEPLTKEDVLNIVEIEKPEGLIVQFGGQTPLKLAVSLEKEGVKILGTSPDSIDRAEDRMRFQELLAKLGLKQPDNGIARSFEESEEIAEKIGYPVLVRPSYVLGGRAMEIVYDKDTLKEFMAQAVKVSPEHPILIDKFLKDAIELDVDALCDGDQVVIGGIMEHIEEAGVHSGDSACSLPPFSLKKEIIEEIKSQTLSLGLELHVIGLMNIQFAVKDGEIYVLEVNPRASRTVPFVSKAMGIPLAKIATKLMIGRKLKDLGFLGNIPLRYISVKEAVFPFDKLPGVDTILGPEMKSTGEVMGIDMDFGMAFAKSQIAAGSPLPLEGKVFISVKDGDKEAVLEPAMMLKEMGFSIVATHGTALFLNKYHMIVERINKVKEGSPHIVDYIKNGEIAMVINTTIGAQEISDSFSIRRSALVHKVPYFTTIAGARAAVSAIKALKEGHIDVKPLQEHHKTIKSQ